MVLNGLFICKMPECILIRHFYHVVMIVFILFVSAADTQIERKFDEPLFIDYGNEILKESSSFQLKFN